MAVIRRKAYTLNQIEPVIKNGHTRDTASIVDEKKHII